MCKLQGRDEALPVGRVETGVRFREAPISSASKVVAGISTLSMIAEYVDDEATVMQMVGGIKLQLAATNASRRPLETGLKCCVAAVLAS